MYVRRACLASLFTLHKLELRIYKKSRSRYTRIRTDRVYWNDAMCTCIKTPVAELFGCGCGCLTHTRHGSSSECLSAKKLCFCSFLVPCSERSDTLESSSPYDVCDLFSRQAPRAPSLLKLRACNVRIRFSPPQQLRDVCVQVDRAKLMCSVIKPALLKTAC